jgi:hypothetical protein
LLKYQEKRYRLFGKPTGVIVISDKSRVEGLIMCALRLALLSNRKIKRNRRADSNSSDITMSAITAYTEIHSDMEDDNDNNKIFFYNAAANAFDHSPTVREYFCNNCSRINPNNKSLWPLRYHAYKEYGL